VLAPEAAGRDLLVSAQTGSGKTVAFGLALAPDAAGRGRALPPGARRWRSSSRRRANWRCRCSASCLALCRGRRARRLLRRRHGPAARAAPARAGAHIVVGTPGRLRDHLERGASTLEALRAVVLDEADEMLDLGFREDLEFILEATPAERRTLLFSATVPRGIAALAKRYQRDALRIEAAPASAGMATSSTAPSGRPAMSSSTPWSTCCAGSRPGAPSCSAQHARRRRAPARQPAERGFSAVALSGELTQPSATARCRRCATGGRGSASRPTSPRAASTCRTSAWSSTPNCRATRHAAAPQRPHRPRRAQGRQRAAGAASARREPARRGGHPRRMDRRGEGGAPPPRFRQRPDEGREPRDAKPFAKKRPPPGAPKGKAERGGFKHRKNRERQ
jgi:hypothetical protein